MDIHVLKCSKDLKTVRVIFHYAVPEGENQAGISWQNAIVMGKGGAGNIKSVLADIDTDELADMKTGALVEPGVETIRFSSINLTNTERLQEIKDKYKECKEKFLKDKQVELAFMGYSTNGN